ncbi:MAG: proton-conducting transporter membrane subunit [Lentisphaerota bacterium]
MDLALILFPLIMALVAFAIPSNRLRPWILPVTGAGHLALTLHTLIAAPVRVFCAPWLTLDPLGRLVLLLLSVLFVCNSVYTVSFLRHNERSNRIYCTCLSACLSATTLLVWANHLGIMWISIETMALCTAPLIFFLHTPQAIEAAWKYLLIGSVGIALALLGSFFLAYASLHAGLHPTLIYSDLLKEAGKLSKPWLHAAFVMMLVGYGTKMGLAPMHTWLPDAHSEAPSPISAMLSGSLLPCAFLAVLRIYHICLAAGEGAFVTWPLLVLGLFSMAVAGVFIVGQRDFKRMLAYSSVEHMGILALGLSIGGRLALFGTLLHLLNHGLTKVVMFLSAGNIYHAYGSKSTDQVRGALRRVPWSAAIFLAGFMAMTGSPPFGPFISEFTILNAAFIDERYISGALFLLFLLIVFIGMGAAVLGIVQGRPPRETPAAPFRENAFNILPPLLCLAAVLMLGLFIPAPLGGLITAAVQFLETTP